MVKCGLDPKMVVEFVPDERVVVLRTKKRILQNFGSNSSKASLVYFNFPPPFPPQTNRR